MKKLLSILVAIVMLFSVMPVTIYADSKDYQYYQDLFCQGLADPTFKKTTKNYDGYKFVAGSEVSWDCILYTLTAKVTKVSGNNVTFNVIFNSKIPGDAIDLDAYRISIGTKTFNFGENMQYTLDTSDAHEGMNFLKLKVEKHEKNTFVMYSTSKYYEAIRKNRETAPKTTDYIDEYWLEDVYYVSYYKKPDLSLNSSYYKVTKNSISLGTYTFNTIIKYRKKGEKKWKDKSFAANKKISFTGLKAGTVYEFTPLFSLPFDDPESGQKKMVVDTLGKPFYLVTVFNKKPKISSVKITKIKFKKRKMDGYWEKHSDGRSVWHSSETFNTASYTVKIKVKKAPKNVKGLYVKCNNVSYFVKGKKSTYTLKLYYQDRKKLKGKKMTFRFGYASNSFNNSPIGIGPLKKMKYKLKKGKI